MRFHPLHRLAIFLVPLGAYSSAAAQEVTLRIHHFLPPAATIQAQVFLPWCEKIGRESGGRLKCQIYPAMQLGGAPPQLFDQARDGVADIVWTSPTYQSGRFVKSEVFELPFFARSAESGSPALWEYIQRNAVDEFRGVKLIAAHLHDGSLLHFTSRDIKSMEGLKGLKLRAPSRIGTKFLAALGATPVQMPVPQIPEAMAKAVLDGALVPWEVVPALKLHEIARYHLENAPGQAKMSNSIFVIAMNQGRYDALSTDLRRIIDGNSGLEVSKWIGRIYDATTEGARKLAAARNGVFTNLTAVEVAKWEKATEVVARDWVTEATAKGANGAALLESARELVRKHGG